MTDGLLRFSARYSCQHFVSFSWCSRARCFEGDGEEALTTFANNDGRAAKTVDQFKAIFDLDVKNVCWPCVMNNKHSETSASSWDCELVSGVKDSDQGVTWVHYITRVALKVVSSLCLSSQPQVKGHRGRSKRGCEVGATCSTGSDGCCSKTNPFFAHEIKFECVLVDLVRAGYGYDYQSFLTYVIKPTWKINQQRFLRSRLCELRINVGEETKANVRSHSAMSQSEF